MFKKKKKKKQNFCLKTIKYTQTVKCKFGEFGLFSEMPELVPGRMSDSVQHVAHITSPKPTALLAKN